MLQVVRRGNYPNGSLCYFASKLDNAISAGAQGLIIVNNQPSTGRPNLYMVAPEGADTSDFGTVPCLMVSRTEGEWLIGNLTNAQRTAPTQTSVGQVIESNTAAQKLWQYTALYISDGTGYFSRSLKNVLYVSPEPRPSTHQAATGLASLRGCADRLLFVCMRSHQVRCEQQRGVCWSVRCPIYVG